MATPVIIPKQGQSVESCIISEWHKKKGDRVKKGDLLFTFETDKASFDEECPEDGILLDVIFNEGDEVPVLTTIAIIGREGENIIATSETSAKSEKPQEVNPADNAYADTRIEKEKNEKSFEAGGIKISPLAKKIAMERGISYSNISGTGPNGRIIARDVKTFPIQPVKKDEKANEGANDYKDFNLSNVRKVIMKTMQASLQNSAQLTHHLSADARKILTLRKKVKSMVEKGYKFNITLNDMICYSAVKAIQKHPDANAHFFEDKIRRFKKVHLGFAVDTDRGLLVPTIKNADEYSLPELSSELKTAADLCRKGNINPDLLASTAASFTITNLGNYGVEVFTPILNLPQVCILGINTIINRPVLLEEGAFGFVPYLGLSLTYDHRAIDGGPATLFLAEVKNQIENFDTNVI